MKWPYSIYFGLSAYLAWVFFVLIVVALPPQFTIITPPPRNLYQLTLEMEDPCKQYRLDLGNRKTSEKSRVYGYKPDCEGCSSESIYWVSFEVGLDGEISIGPETPYVEIGGAQSYSWSDETDASMHIDSFKVYE